MEEELTQALADLSTRRVGREVLYYPVVTSTMEVAEAAARGGAAEGTVVLADEQTAGRGRLGRSWISPRGQALAISIVFRPSAEELPSLPMLASLAGISAIRHTTGIPATIKWPNDLMMNGKKVGGILATNYFHEGHVHFSILGIGINVNLDLSAFPDIATTATSLAVEAGRELARGPLLRRLLEDVDTLYQSVKDGEPLHHRWREGLETLGKMIRVTLLQGVEEGTAEAVDELGCLYLRRNDGSLTKIVAGDVTTLRPA